MLQEILRGLTAQTADPAGGGPGAIFGSVVFPMVLIFGVMYFLIIRPQSKQQKQHQTFLSQLKKGDEVVLQGGMFARVYSVAEEDAVVEIAPGVKVHVLKSGVTSAAPGHRGDAKSPETKAEEKKS